MSDKFLSVIDTPDKQTPEPVGAGLSDSWSYPLATRKPRGKITSDTEALDGVKSAFKSPKSGFVPLSSLLNLTDPELRLRPSVSPLTYLAEPDPKRSLLEKLVAGLSRDDLINKFTTNFSSKLRIAALFLADELIRRDIPPSMWFGPHTDTSKHDVNQKSDLIIFDLRWLRHAYPEHCKKVSYKRLFNNNETTFHKIAEYLIYGGGNREPWEIAASLKLSVSQQYEMIKLQSVPVSRQSETTHDMRDKVHTAIREHSERTRKTKAYTPKNAKETTYRRHRLWLCSRTVITFGAELSRRYEQMTGSCITVNVAKRQLKITEEILAEAHIIKRKKRRQRKTGKGKIPIP